jgi:hypothetical protein
MILSGAMLPSTCVVVPTYWTRAGGESRVGDAVYDHPTALDGPDTLTALLQSLNGLDTSRFYVLILVAVTADDVANEAEGRVRAILERFPSIPSLTFGPSHLGALLSWLATHGCEDATSFLQLRQYPRIRNLQLALPHALHAEAIVALDDDEIVTDPQFIEKAVEPLGSTVDGRRVDGLSGHYLQDDGGILLRVDPVKAQSENIFDRKAVIMNEATTDLDERPGNLVETPFCFGGNMEFSADLAASVGFDPDITRGEDIDYLINARMEGRTFFLRKDLRILHRPPKGGSYKDASRSKLEQDIIRFLYEQAKLDASETMDELRPVSADSLGAYPGRFLREDIVPDACVALGAVGFDRDPTEFVREVQNQNAARIGRYLRFRKRWPEVQQSLHDSAEVRDQLIRLVRGI